MSNHRRDVLALIPPKLPVRTRTLTRGSVLEGHNVGLAHDVAHVLAALEPTNVDATLRAGLTNDVDRALDLHLDRAGLQLGLGLGRANVLPRILNRLLDGLGRRRNEAEVHATGYPDGVVLATTLRLENLQPELLSNAANAHGRRVDKGVGTLNLAHMGDGAEKLDVLLRGAGREGRDREQRGGLRAHDPTRLTSLGDQPEYTFFSCHREEYTESPKLSPPTTTNGSPWVYQDSRTTTEISLSQGLELVGISRLDQPSPGLVKTTCACGLYAALRVARMATGSTPWLKCEPLADALNWTINAEPTGSR